MDLTDYTIVYASDLTTGGKQQAVDFAKSLKTATGLALRSRVDTETAYVETEDLEILIGNTGRKETEKALSKVNGTGWTVRVFDHKLVIVGTTPFLTRVALNWFTQTYLTADHASEHTLSVHQSVLLSNMETTALTVDGAGQYAIVYGDRVDDVSTDTAYSADDNPQGGIATDYIYDLSVEIQSLLAATTGAKSSTFPFKEEGAASTNTELLVGNMDRTEMREELAKIEADEYAITVRDSKIMLVAWNDATLKSTYTLLEDMLKGCAVTDENGKTSYLIPANCTVKENAGNDWVTDFPKPTGENIALDGTVEVADNSIEYVYSGSGVTRESYVAYCQTLEAAGFKTLAAENQTQGSSFRTYLNEGTGVTLHVYHVAYAHAEAQKVTDVLASIRIVASTTEDVNLPDAEMLTPNQEYEWKTAPRITQLQLLDSTTVNSAGEILKNFGMSYLITLADGSFIMYDGGIGRADDATNLWNVMSTIHEEISGAEVSIKNPIRIRAWVMTHEHSDHFTVFRKFCKEYGPSGKLIFERLLANYTSDTERYNCHNPENTVQLNMATLQSQAGFKYIKVHTGQVFYFANLKMEVLYTHEDIYPKRLEYFNNSTTIVRTTLSALNGKSDTKTSTCIWLGDAERIASRRLRAMYGTSLDVDQVQVAHHGHTGVEWSLYEIMSPDVLWWPTNCADFRGYINKNTSSRAHADTYEGCQGSTCTSTAPWYYCVDYHLAYSLDSVKLICVAALYNTTMVITGNESDYVNLKNIADPDKSTIVYTKYYNGEVIRPSKATNQNTVILKQEIK
ncbi:MAG: hypothetical protein IJX39_10550 [Clostridia bacterium]|nr:hypothetical protein [Clostridia bacterium]